MSESSQSHPEWAHFKPGVISQVVTQSKNTNRVSVSVAGEFSFGVARIVAAQFGLRSGVSIDAELAQRIYAAEQQHQAIEAAIRLLTTRPRSQHEIEVRLRQRKFDQATIDAAVSELERRNYLNDADFAAFWVENREANKPRGRLLLRQELRQKGIENSIIETAIESAEIDELQLAIELVEKRMPRLSDLEPQVQRRRLLSFLERRGFAFDVSKRAVELATATEGDSFIDYANDEQYPS